MNTIGLVLRTLCCLWLLAAVACSDDVESGGLGAEATSGGDDWDETDGWAKKVPKKERAPQQESTDPAAPKTMQDFRPDVPDAAAVAPEQAPPPPPPQGGPSIWGAPDAECSTPLPKRAEMKSAAKSAYSNGLAFVKKGDNAGAKTAFEQALAADPRAYEAAYNLGVVLDRLGKTNQALQEYGRALKIQPDYERAVDGAVSIYRRQGSASQAVNFVQPIARRYECNLYLQAILADALTAADRVNEAEEVARAALKRDERFVPAMLALVRSSQKRGRTELADSILSQAKEVNDKNPEVRFLDGERQREEGNLAQALSEYREAVKLRPDYAEARMALGIQYMAGGNYGEAQQQFEAVARLMPTLVAVRLNLGDAYRANKHWKEAKREFDTALRMKDPLPEAHFNLGLMYMSAGEEFPGLNKLDALNRAILEFNNYRRLMGPRLTKDDPSTGYMADLERQVERERKRIEREEARKKREAERAARQDEEASE